LSWATAYIEQLKAGKTVTFKPRGNSMRPHIESGQTVVVKPSNLFLLKKGDIVLCKVNGRQYLHFISAVSSANRYQISNASGFVNGWVSPDGVYGKVVSIGD